MKRIMILVVMTVATGLLVTPLVHAQAERAAEPAKGEGKVEAKEEAKGEEMSADAKRAILMDPNSSEMTAKAPDVFKVKFETSKGDIILEVKRELSPLGVDRFYNLVRFGFYDEARFFRVMDGFMAQFGLNADPRISKKWKNAGIKDEPVKTSNARGTVTFAKRGSPNSRTTQLFINFGNNKSLDGQGFSPFAEVVEGMDVVDSIYSKNGQEPDQGKIQEMGNKYLIATFPRLDYIKTATIVTE